RCYPRFPRGNTQHPIISYNNLNSLHYEYHHINGFRPEGGHLEAEITLLCDTCHRKATNRFFSKEAIADANENPHNRSESECAPDTVWMHVGNSVQIRLGENLIEFVNVPLAAALVIDGNPICALEREDNHTLLNLSICDDHDRPIVTVRRSELVYRTSEVDDVECKGEVLTIRRSGRIIFRARFRPPEFTIIECEAWWNGVSVEIREQRLLLDRQIWVSRDGGGPPAAAFNLRITGSIRITDSARGAGFLIGRNNGGWAAGLSAPAPKRRIFLPGAEAPTLVPEGTVPIDGCYRPRDQDA
ncbi:MAG: hypothetical protein ACP5O1_05885, partial [Phycisphaerae bacterium]